MHKLPIISGTELIKALTKIGYLVIRQKGSHVQLQKETNFGMHRITVPNHKVISFGIVNDIVKSVCEKNNIPREELISKL